MTVFGIQIERFYRTIQTNANVEAQYMIIDVTIQTNINQNINTFTSHFYSQFYFPFRREDKVILKTTNCLRTKFYELLGILTKSGHPSCSSSLMSCLEP